MARPDDAFEAEWTGKEPQDELIDTLEQIERCRRDLQEHGAYFIALLRAEPQLRRQWSEFLQAGGLTSTDLRQFLAGRFRYRRVRIRQRRHLRLIEQRGRVIKHSQGGNDAA